ncbi:GNAT superfamily N-acetyltransferase [Pedobacter africanus]
MRMIIRIAKPEDLSTLLEFEQGVISAERPFNPTLIDGKIQYYDLNYLMSTDEAVVAVAEEGGVAIASGYALIKKAEKPYFNFETYAYLGFMYVKPEYRGRGVNKLILDFLIDWSKEKGITEIRLDVYDKNESAIAAYEKAGFEPLLLTMRLKS